MVRGRVVFLALWRNKEVCTEFIVMQCTLSATVSRAFWLQFLLVLLPLIFILFFIYVGIMCLKN